MNKRQRKKAFAKMLCEHGKTMCFACLISDAGLLPLRIHVTEIRSPGHVVRLEMNTFMAGL